MVARIRTPSPGTRPVALTATGSVRAGASSHVARFLLAAREHHPELQYAANCRYDATVADALHTLDWPTASDDRADEPTDAPGTMDWGTHQAYRDADARTTVAANELDATATDTA